VGGADVAGMGVKVGGGGLLGGSTGAAAAFFMYEGPSGERYTFYCARADAPGTALRYQAAGSVAAFYWVDANKGYAVSGPADRDRLLRVAQTIYAQLDGRPPGRS